MSDNPLETNPKREAEIEERARKLWEASGSPEGRMDEFRERADELVRMELSGISAQKPIDDGSPIPGKIVEEAFIQENLGEFPGGQLADQGEWRETPMTRDELREGGEEQPRRAEVP